MQESYKKFCEGCALKRDCPHEDGCASLHAYELGYIEGQKSLWHNAESELPKDGQEIIALIGRRSFGVMTYHVVEECNPEWWSKAKDEILWLVVPQYEVKDKL